MTQVGGVTIEYGGTTILAQKKYKDCSQRICDIYDLNFAQQTYFCSL